jgi:hypothetical protein
MTQLSKQLRVGAGEGFTYNNINIINKTGFTGQW